MSATELAAFLAKRQDGRVVPAREHSSSPGDVAIGSIEKLAMHRGEALFAVADDALQGSDRLDVGWNVWFEGTSPSSSSERIQVEVWSRHARPQQMARESESEMPRCVAIIAAYNEADIIGSVVSHLVEQQIEVYLIDNWSTDETMEIGRDLMDRGLLVGLERFPEEPVEHHIWDRMLNHKAEVAMKLGTDWAIHNDADEIRYSPWVDLTLGEGITVADSLGFNAIDFTVVEHPPSDDRFSPGMDVVESFPYYRFGNRPGHFRQIKAWKPGGRVAEMGAGHDIQIPDRRLFPFNFMVRHYPIRSQSHGTQKVFRDRVPRWDPKLRAQGWHRQYDLVDESTVFTLDPEQLEPFNPQLFRRDRLGELIARVGLEPRRW